MSPKTSGHHASAVVDQTDSSTPLLFGIKKNSIVQGGQLLSNSKRNRCVCGGLIALALASQCMYASFPEPLSGRAARYPMEVRSFSMGTSRWLDILFIKHFAVSICVNVIVLRGLVGALCSPFGVAYIHELGGFACHFLRERSQLLCSYCIRHISSI